MSAIGATLTNARPNAVPSNVRDGTTPGRVSVQMVSKETQLANLKGQEQFEKELRNIGKQKDRQVAVLLLSWDMNNEHSMNTTNEIKDLTTVLEDKYNFKVHSELLSTKKPQQPRHQMNRILNEFLGIYDRPNTLLLIYYGGHGLRSDDKEELRLLGENPDEDDPAATELMWSDVEPTLYRLTADLLLIFDCCYAGMVPRHARDWPAAASHFEFIGSTAHDKTARGPKDDGSFTRAMINALHELAEEKEFTPAILTRKINRSKVFRKTHQNPVPSTCGKRNTDRELKIMKSIRKPQSQAQVIPGLERGESVNFYLHLKYVLREKLSSEQITALTERVKDLVKNDRLPIEKVLWEGLSEGNPKISFYDAAHMLLAKLQHQRCTEPTGQLEVSACTGRPNALLQRTHTTLTMDDGIPVTRETHVPEVVSCTKPAIDKSAWSSRHHAGFSFIMCLGTFILFTAFSISRSPSPFYLWLLQNYPLG